MGRYDSRKGPSSLARANGERDEPTTLTPLRYGERPNLSHRSESVLLIAECGDTVAMRVRGREWAAWAVSHWRAVAERDGYSVERDGDTWRLRDSDGALFVTLTLQG